MSEKTLPSVRPAILRLPIWHILAVAASACAILLIACSVIQYHSVGPGPRTVRAMVIALLLAGVAGAALAIDLPRSSWGSTRRRAKGTPALPMSLALTGLVAVAGMTVTAFLVLYPPPLEHSVFKQWDYRDKRWLIALFLLANGLVYAPGFFNRLLAGPLPRRPLAAARTATSAMRRGLLCAGFGGLLALLYVAPLLPGTDTRYLDAHEQVHLGGVQRIAQGGLPYIDARTQYGPGLQIVTYAMMRHSEFTLRGFRLSQAWLNLVAVALLFAVWLFAFGARTGGAVIAAALAVSPLLIVTFWGWGLVLRWLAPVLVGTIVPLLLWREVRGATRVAIVAVLAAACGLLAWLAQENLTGAIVALALLLAAGVVRGVVPVRTAIILGALFVAVEVATLVILIALSVGFVHLHQAISLYFLSTGIVFQGLTNTTWSEPASTWRRAYRWTPLVILAITAAGLYLRRRDGDAEEEARLGQVLGMAAAAVPLTMLTLFRADPPHFIGPSTALAPLVVLTVACLPGRFRWGVNPGNVARAALVGLFLLLYFNPLANYRTRIGNDRTFSDPRRIGKPGQTIAGLRLLRNGLPASAARSGVAAGDVVSQRLGYTPAPDGRCCHNNEWTWAEWAATVRRIHDDTRGRPTFVDVTLPLESSGLYFLADLTVATPYVSRIMSIWTDDDIRTVMAELRRRPPACVVSGAGALFTADIVKGYGRYTVDHVPGPAGVTVYCAAAAPTPVARHP